MQTRAAICSSHLGGMRSMMSNLILPRNTRCLSV